MKPLKKQSYSLKQLAFKRTSLSKRGGECFVSYKKKTTRAVGRKLGD